MYLRMNIRAYCPHVPKSPKMRVYRGGILCPYLRMYIRSRCPHVPRSPKIKVHKGCIVSFVSFVQSIQNSILSDVLFFFFVVIYRYSIVDSKL